MSRRPVFVLPGVLLAAYLVGLALYLPPDRLELWLKSASGGRVGWEAMTLGWEGLRFTRVRFVPPLFSQDKPLDQITLRPRLFPLLMGNLGMAYQFQFETTRIQGEGAWDGQQTRLEWRIDLEDLARVMELWLGPMGTELQGKGKGAGWLTATTRAPMVLESGAWELQLQGMSAFGARMDPFTLTGTVKEKNLMEIKLTGKGEIAVAGKVTLQATPPNLRASSVQGELQIQPITPNLGGVLGQMLGKGQPVKMLLSGSVENLQWRTQ
ncbi:MAG: hypothetical protein HQM02_10545 [Magnetococcales bacterium]|nr:hypothetical protein [Magnetococcales bacterium]